MEPLEWLTLGLLLVTGYYAVTTHFTLRELRKQRETEREMWRRDKSEAAVRAVLEALNEESDRINQRGGPTALRNGARSLVATLRTNGPLVRDELLRDRIAATRDVVYVAMFPDEQMRREGISADLVCLHAAEVIRRLIGVLTRYLREEDPTSFSWDGLPEQVEAAAWIRRKARQDEP